MNLTQKFSEFNKGIEAYVKSEFKDIRMEYGQKIQNMTEEIDELYNLTETKKGAIRPANEIIRPQHVSEMFNQDENRESKSLTKKDLEIMRQNVAKHGQLLQDIGLFRIKETKGDSLTNGEGMGQLRFDVEGLKNKTEKF